MSSPIADALGALAEALEGVGDGWYLFGAQAALLRGSRRLTSDIDVTICPGEVRNAFLVERLQTAGFELRVPDVDGFVDQTRVIPLVHAASQMPVDVVIGGPGLERLFLDAAELVALDGVNVRVAIADHLVVMKLLAAREKDFEDAAALVRTGGVDLDAVGELVATIAKGLGEDDIRRAFEHLRSRVEGQLGRP